MVLKGSQSVPLLQYVPVVQGMPVVHGVQIVQGMPLMQPAVMQSTTSQPVAPGPNQGAMPKRPYRRTLH